MDYAHMGCWLVPSQATSPPGMHLRLSPRRRKSNTWESCLVQAKSLPGYKPNRPIIKDIRLCMTDPADIQFSIGGDVWQENLCLLYTYINPCSHAYNLRTRTNKVLEITVLILHTLCYIYPC